MRKLLVAESAGFCFGVSRSVDLAEKLIKSVGSCYSYGPIIHNDEVVKEFEKKGLRVVSGAVNSGDNVLIRAHGVAPNTILDLEEAGAVITDATCPKVKAIHKIVANASAHGNFVIIIGMNNHPEVNGIKGWCKDCEVFENGSELTDYFSHNKDIINRKITVVAQTTQIRENYDKCICELKKLCTNVEVFDTICHATSTRQSEAMQLSKICDAMIVIGGKNSANSVHLADICFENCQNVQFIENISELDLSRISKCDVVGLTAGASTPTWIIEEVRNIMSEEILNSTVSEEQSFDEMLEESLKPIHNGDKVVGTVVAINGNEVTIDLGAKYSGIIPSEEFISGGAKLEDAVHVGDEIEAKVVKVSEMEGIANLSKKKVEAEKFWDEIEKSAEDGAIIEGIVTGVNGGGVEVTANGARIFVPASQTDLPRDADLNELLKKAVKLKVLEVNKARRRVVGSIRQVARAERKAATEAIWNEIEVGKKYLGKVKSLTNYGAFVDIGGIDGMVHITELGWGRIKHPSEVVNPGDEVEVYVINFDKDNRRISLGYKDPTADPWKKFEDNFKVDDVIECKIVKLMPFGAFAEITDGVDGLIHISQLSNKRIANCEEAVKVGDIVTAKITAIDNEKQKISLSIRALMKDESEDMDVPVDEAADIITEAAEADVEADLENEENA